MWKENLKYSIITTVILFLVAHFIFNSLNNRFISAYLSTRSVLWYVWLLAIGWCILILYLAFKEGVKNNWGCAIAYIIIFVVSFIFDFILTPVLTLAIARGEYNNTISSMYLISIPIAFIVGWLVGRVKGVATTDFETNVKKT